MRFIVIIKANEQSEAGEMPSEQVLSEMGKFNEELVNAGVMLSAEGLHPSRKAAKVKWTGKTPTVIDGPFTETKELVAGFWIWKCASLDEAKAWARRIPNPDGVDSEVTIQQIFSAEDFGAELTPEMERLREKLAERQQQPS